MGKHKITFNHYAIEVVDVRKSIIFYEEILGLEKINRPDFDFNGAWFAIGMGLELHLIENTNKGLIEFSGSRSLHFAYRIDNIHLFKDFLIAKDITIIKDIKARPDGVLQLFFTDPDGYYIEATELSTI